MIKKTLLLLAAGALGSAWATPKVVSTLKPLHALVAQISDGVFEPTLLIKQASPHGYQLTTADSQALAEADILLWVGKDMETFLPPLLPKLKKELVNINWSELEGVELLPTRTGGAWAEAEEHHHHHHHHDEDEPHDHDHEHEHHHHHGVHDLHLWLSTKNGEVLLKAIAEALSQADPEHKPQYQANLTKASAALQSLHEQTAEELRPYQKTPYLVFHAAYQYFEKDYQLQPLGSVRVSPEHEPTPARLAELQAMLAEKKSVCVFNEPQFPAKIVDKLVSGTKVKVATLDPLGADLPADKNAYGQIIQNLAKNLKGCLQ